MNKRTAGIARWGILFLGILIIGFSQISCSKSKELSREKAAEIISQVKYGYGSIEGTIPVAVDEGFQMGDGGGNTAEYASKAEEASREWINATKSKLGLDKLKGEGFITYDIWEGPQGSRPPGFNPAQRGMYDYMYRWVQISIKPTDKLALYVSDSDKFKWKVRLIDMVFDKITGVTKTSENDAVVEFAMKPINTPLYGLVVAPAQNNLILNRSATFRRYDDGWRLVR